MLKTTIIPDKISINILIPVNYIGKKIEILLYALDEVSDNQTKDLSVKRKPSDYAGCMSNETAQTYLQDIAKSRKEWETGF